ncbi:MAG: hypothetical protein EPO41_03240 [Reyranella sp.]|uniref:hypothetical protein n=1 Tax=Reyranella sp. TaxID=1929291 RepID=UPI00120C8DED|nr:hypothetical protein [Reyranella sp.]TAJ97433.1 MAG: hypothetical protein EPO41_03240 [Reyranella sp.]
MNSSTLVVIGTVLVVLGLIGFAFPMFTTKETTELARLGELKLETTQTTTHVVPPLVIGGVLVAGVILLGAGLYRKR